MSDQNTKSEKVQNSRYWEYYLVRYLLGTVIGVVCVLYIGKSVKLPDEEFNFFEVVSTDILSQSPRTTANVGKGRSSFLKDNPVILLLIGFVYTYIASAPILVLHSIRLRKREHIEKNKFGKYLTYLVVSLAVFYLLLSLYGYYKYSIWPSFSFFEFLSVVLLIFVVLGQTFLLSYRFKQDLAFKERTEKLSQKRSGNSLEKNYISDFVESYRHLREHSNAFFITLFTIVLTFIICNQNLFPTELIIFFWIVPSSVVWFVATKLEISLID